MIKTATDPSAQESPQSQWALASTTPIRCLVVDDHPAVRMGLKELLDDQSDFVVLDALATAEAAVAFVEHTAIDVAVVDYHLGGRNGLWVSRKLKRLRTPPRVIVYSAYSDGILAAACVVAEADGLVSKARVGSELCDAIRRVAQGQLLLPTVKPALADSMRRRLESDEQAIFGMLLAGISTPEIARTLGFSAGELESRLWTMLRKLERLDVEPPASARNRGRIETRRAMRRLANS
jgi:DNA-binding NarL/FixJ family response regulator